LIAEWGLGRPHILAPDVGTGTALMLAAHVRRYPEELRVLADLLPAVDIPVLVMNPEHDELVPPSNGVYLHERLPYNKLINLDSAHFPWEQSASEYGDAVRDWVSGGYSTAAGADR
jgi:pimeloyl-ACP methyl ester carboxylesterase